MPLFCCAELAFFDQSAEKVPIWLWERATYVLALERTCLELLIRWKIRVSRSRSGEPEPQLADWRRRPLVKWFDKAPEGYIFWLRRFHDWRNSARKSFLYYIGKHAPDTRHFDPTVRWPAFLGMMQKFFDLPVSVFGGMLDKLASDPWAAEIFQRNAHKRESHLTGLALNTWLIEIWPLVTTYHWTYSDVLLTAGAKFASSSNSLKTVSQIEDRCKSLELYLSASGQNKTGRPRKKDEGAPVLSPFGSLALFIESIGCDEADWIRGQSDLAALSSTARERVTGN